MTRAKRIAVVTPDTLAAAMAGPAIRAWQMATALANEHDVVLATISRADIAGDGFDVKALDDEGLRRLVAWSDVMIVQGWVLARRPWLIRSDVVMVVDVYDPLHLEQLEQGRDDPARQRREVVWHATAVLNEQLLRADLVLCASEQQRLFWLGTLGALGRLNPASYDADRALRSLLQVVPFGLPDEPPVQSQHGIRGVVPGIGMDDRVVLWGGGVYNWFDPLTLLSAIARLRERVTNVRLVFMGLRHPNPELPEMRMAVAARELSDSLGLTGMHVFFNEGWVPYESRADHLLDADVGVSCHELHLETELSFRTRILDYLWAGLPVVTSAGDSFASLIQSRGLGLVVEPGDVEGLADALERILTDASLADACRANVRAVATELRWSHALAPLLAFCREPVRAPDLVDNAQRRLIAAGPPVGVPATAGVRGGLERARGHLREGGVGLLARRSAAAAWRRSPFSRGRAGHDPPPPPD